MSIETILLIIAGGLSALVLVSLMRRRQAELTAMLREYVDSQLVWARKRARAARLARSAANDKIGEVDLSIISSMLMGDQQDSDQVTSGTPPPADTLSNAPTGS
ncbi:MAG: hypothetical protein KF752_16700 [Pirellulaceae bacterium]|nr:hypothetical protein [Pirellulaceae bacterium]